MVSKPLSDAKYKRNTSLKFEFIGVNATITMISREEEEEEKDENEAEDDPQASEAALRLKALLRREGLDTAAAADSVVTILPPSSANTILPGSVNTILPGSLATAVPVEVSERALPLIFGCVLAAWLLWLCSRQLEHLPQGIPAILLGLWMTFQVHKVQNFAVLVKPVLVWMWLATLPGFDRMTWWALGLQMPSALVSAGAIYLWAVEQEKASADTGYSDCSHDLWIAL
ncbi:unnamed protein product [Symbiodinium necroappetens]|uniref:Uncharacterized protein n=1 Tax=Symbiodinium necroappetens TaxID=1628268 RepID=A0A813BC57_9DINO|nr:unnamed protein product [Symbiodinium necroappetens]